MKTGPLAQGGIQMEQGINLFFKHRGQKLPAARRSNTVPEPSKSNKHGQEPVDAAEGDVHFR